MRTRPSPIELEADAAADDDLAAAAFDPDRASCPRGFRAGGFTAGLRKSGKPDLALFLCDEPNGASAAGVFTLNLVRAAPVDISAENLKASGGRCRALVINSGCANAATGDEGRRRAMNTVRALAEQAACDASRIQVASTGVIGVHLPDDKIAAALPAALAAANEDNLPAAAHAILTTDTVVKMCELKVDVGGKTLHVAGCAKGSGMIHPNMATMIGVVMTDADVEPDRLQSILSAATDRTFNRISVDGDTSTNDCVYLLASGAAGTFPLDLVKDAVTRVCRELALKIVKDGEGAHKVVRVQVTGARTRDDAKKVAETVAGSMLVRTAITGGDPNWGRILAASGRAGVPIDLAAYRLTASGVPLFEKGSPADSPYTDRKRAFAGPDVSLEIDLGQGSESDEFFTCDLTEGYIKINAEYTT